MGDLIDFLLARIQQDEARIRALMTDVGMMGQTVLRHHLTQNLAECDAKRRMIAHVRDVDWDHEPASDYDYMLTFLQHMALPYQTHTGYQSAWRL
ncbi:DUF6221 family protein [Arthrobacter crystallopoietes]|uniref:DUF6221 family protein n=1 Tax=Crystallibacter crystallopoietes TaxID=37928 RepID=UPI0011110A44|nr:DUF6221 family protein [Arthrobacter crystallopoietes]